MAKTPERITSTWPHDEPAPPTRNPQVIVGAREDKVLYGTKGQILIRIEDRPIGFRRGMNKEADHTGDAA